MKRIGIALGGGGAKGFAHIGVIKALRKKEEFLPSIIAGTSAGSIVATLYASGLAQSKLEESAMEFDWFHDVINLMDTAKLIVGRKMGGLLSNASLGKTINELIEGRGFNDLETELAIVATDIENRRRVIFTSERTAKNINREELLRFLPEPEPENSKPGFSTLVISDFEDIGKAVQASCAVPGVFQPVEIGGMKLLDGGLVDQIPVDVVRAMGAEVTIGVSLALATIRERISNPMDAAGSVLGILGLHQVRRSLDLADIGFQISGIEKRSSINPKQYELLQLGESEMERHIKALELILEIHNKEEIDMR